MPIIEQILTEIIDMKSKGMSEQKIRTYLQKKHRADERMCDRYIKWMNECDWKRDAKTSVLIFRKSGV